MFNKKGSMAVAVVGIIGGTAAILIGAYMLSPVATAITDAGAKNSTALCTTWIDATHTCSVSPYASAQSLLMNVPMFVVLGIIVSAIVLMVIHQLKD